MVNLLTCEQLNDWDYKLLHFPVSLILFDFKENV